MDWSNNNILEFIELLQSEPSIWDPKKKSHKNRMMVNDAWERIKNTFSLQCSVDELKKKRNSLMAAYREQLKKNKDSYTTGSSTDDMYQPSWFAFEAMHSFLGPIYEYHNTINTEEQTTPNSERPLSRNSDMGMGSGNESPQNEQCSKRKNTTQTKDLLQVKKRMDEAFSLVKERNVQKQTDENDLFGQLVAQKLKKMNEDDRLMLTHDIHNLIFKYEMKARSKLNEQASSSHTTSTLINTPSPSCDFETEPSYPVYIPESPTTQHESALSQPENYNLNKQTPKTYMSTFSTESLFNLKSNPSKKNIKIIPVHRPESPTTQYKSAPSQTQPENYNINIQTPKNFMSTLSTENLINFKPKPIKVSTSKKNIKIISQLITQPQQQSNNILTQDF